MNTPELAAAWRKSSYSGDNGGNCVEVAAAPDGAVVLRHSRDPDGPTLVYTPSEFRAFLAGVKAGEFDDLG